MKSIAMKSIAANSLLAASLTLALPASLQAATINVLWTEGAANYNANVTELAGEAATFDPGVDGSLSWNLTLWDGSALDFSLYDVLVVGSTYGVDQNHGSNSFGDATGFWGNGVSAQGVLDNKAAIEAARGERTFLSGQDADWHDMNNVQDRDDGPKGFSINAVNWAASGAGLGIVSMTDRYYAGSSPDIGWWDHTDSFLAGELGANAFAFQSDSVNIGVGQGGFPINEGLTSAGLSNWGTSSHACFNEIDGYTRINFTEADDGGCGVTIVTTGEEEGGTGGPSVPAPAGIWLMIAGFVGLGLARRRKA